MGIDRLMEKSLIPVDLLSGHKTIGKKISNNIARGSAPLFYLSICISLS